MRKDKMTAMMAAAVLMLSATGCAENQIPEVTEEQLKLMGEYVAVTVLKYDTNHKSRLVELPNTESLYVPTEPSVQTPEPAEPEPGEQDTTQQEEPAATEPPVENIYTLQEVMGVPEGVAVDFLGYRFCNNYPDNGGAEEVFVNLKAADGKKLMVLSFNLSNLGGQDREVDLRRTGAMFQITVDGNYSRRALVTMMDDDLSSFNAMIPAGGSAQAVLIIEVDENQGGNLTELVVNVKNDTKTYTMQLIPAN